MGPNPKAIAFLGILVLTFALIPYDRAAMAQPLRLSPPLVSGGTVLRGILIHPDSDRVVYKAEQDTDDVEELYVVPIGGGAVTRLNGPMVDGGDVRHLHYRISADGSRVLYIADQEIDGNRDLYSVPIDGGASIRLNTPLAPGGTVATIQVSAVSGGLAVYRARRSTDGVDTIYSVPVDGGTVTTLSDTLVDGGNAQNFKLSPDGNWVVYEAYHPLDPELGPDPDGCPWGFCDETVYELYSVPITGGAVTRLNDTLADWGDLHSYQISPDSSRVVFTAEQDTHGVVEIYSVPIEGGTTTKLNSPIVSGGNVRSHAASISPDSTRVVYTADQDSDDTVELYSVPIEGGTATKLNSPIVSGGGIRGDAQISPDGSWVLYKADTEIEDLFDLYSVPINGGTILKLNAPLVSGAWVSRFDISPDSGRVIYWAVDTTNDVFYELYGVSIHGGTVVKLNAPLPSQASVSTTSTLFSPNGRWVIYGADQDRFNVHELYRVSVGGGPVTKLNAPFGPDDDVGGHEVSSDSRHVVFLAGANPRAQPEHFELYTATLPVPNTDDIYVDFAFGATGIGTLESPVDSLLAGNFIANAGATIHLEPGTSSETFTGATVIHKPLLLVNNNPGGGMVIIGQSEARSTQGSTLKSGFVSTGPSRE